MSAKMGNGSVYVLIGSDVVKQPITKLAVLVSSVVAVKGGI